MIRLGTTISISSAAPSDSASAASSTMNMIFQSDRPSGAPGTVALSERPRLGSPLRWISSSWETLSESVAASVELGGRAAICLRAEAIVEGSSLARVALRESITAPV